MSSKTPRKHDDATESAPNKNPFRLWIGIALVIFGLLAVYSGISGILDNKQRLYAPNGAIIIEIVDTPESRQQGLSGRSSLASDQGMMFVFETESQENCFWMKDMQFAIDMVWLDNDKTVVTVNPDVSPETYPESFCPTKPAKYGLEINAGKSSQLEIITGEKLKF